jgi:hypothetical protein
MSDKLKVLLLDPGPIYHVYVSLDEHLREIENSILASPFSNLFEVIPRSSVRVSDLGTYLLRYKPHIVHFVGHADLSTGIILADDEDYLTPVGFKELANILHILKDNIRVVFMVVCYTKAYAEEIARKIDFVIGMDGEISFEAARAFSGSFYQALAFGRSMKDAFEIAKAELNIRGFEGAEVPVLLIRPGVRESESLLNHETCNDAARSRDDEYNEGCEDARRRLIEGIVESLKDRRQDQSDQVQEVFRSVSGDGFWNVSAVLERKGVLTVNFWSSELALEGTWIRLRLGPMSHEITLQRVSDSEVRGSVEIPRRKLPRDFADVSMELP